MSDPAQTAPAPALSFGPFVLDAANATLVREGAPVELAPKAFEVLCFLAQRPGRLVSKEELLDAVWGRRFVSESVLKTVVSQLRAALGDDARQPRYIETASRRGYRFLGETVPAAAAARAQTSSPGAGTPGNIPPALAPLHGRVADIAALCRLLDAHRLVTITGTGGIGKTRLAQAVAHQLRERAPDGAWLVELDALTDGDELPGAIVRALSLNHDAARSVEALARALRPLSVLLVLDNCEHLVEPVATLLAALLPQAPRLQVLATSQERLHLPDEQVYGLEPLALPPPDAAAEAPEQFGAVALFVARVAAAKPGFRLDDDNRAAAIEICRALDGVPLAIELAAARVPLLGVAGVLERLGERLTLLSQSVRNAPPRHRTLLAAIEWSHALLTPEEQTVFRRLAVFSGGFTLEAAQQVVAGEDAHPRAVLDALGALVDKSLLQLVDHGDQRRARLLDSARSYAIEHLRESGEEPALRRAHLRWMHATMRTLDDDVYARPQLQVLRALPELENLRAAMRFASGPDGDRDLAIELAGCSAVFGLAAGIKLEVRGWLERARPWVDEARSDWQRGLFHYAVVSLGSVGVAYSQDESLAAGRLAVEALRRTDDAFRLCYAIYALTVLLRRNGLDGRRELIDEMAALERDDWHPLTRRYRRWTEMGELRARGELEQVRRLWQTEIAIVKAANSPRNVWLSMWSLALVERDLGRLDVAIALASEAVELVREHAQMRSNAMLVSFKAVVLIEHGDVERARDALRVAVPLMLADGLLWWMADAIALFAALDGRLEDGARLHGWADAMVRRHAPGAARAKDWQADYDRLRAQLVAAFDEAELQRLMSAGVGLDDEGAATLLRL